MTTKPSSARARLPARSPLRPDRLTAEAIAAARLPESQAFSLPAEAYTSPGIYRAEIERIFLKEWLCVGRVDQIPNTNDYFSIDLLERRLIVAHGDDGEVRVLSRVCSHRGTDMAVGCGNAKTFRCPYHSWTYRNDGSLTGAPLMKDVEGFDTRDYPLPRIRSEIWEGWIFVNFDGEAVALAPRMAPVSEMLAEYGMRDLVAVEVETYDSPFNWKVLVENFMESYHHIGIHRDTLEPIWPGDAAHVPDNADPYSLLVMPSKSLEPVGTLPPVGEKLQDWQRTALVAGVVWPTHLFAPSSDATAWYHILPHSYDRFTLRIYACYPRATLEDSKLAEEVAGRDGLVRIVHNQDIRACELTWSGLTSGLARPGRLHRLERSIWQQNQWWLDRMEDVVD